ncbi:CHAD domain-containing protein [Agromyces sp. LHK192]|uniref:CHAD domain-containing protein n=1 Tax=Agromyces sp. LHK192 TaxID=2498704 RepID=UPI0013E3F9EE|nr:CHAD domain-containing protein [Agromyces sp. LHK192]
MTTREAFVAVLARYSAELPALLRAAAADEPDAVHQARILVRRTRGVLAAGRRALGRERADALRDELEPIGQDLGVVRDLEVRIAQSEAQVTAGADAAVVDRLIVRERDRYRDAHAVLVDDLEGADRGLDALAAFVADAPGGSHAERPAPRGAAAALRREIRRVGRAERALLGDLDSLHRYRRATRRLRYVAEAFTEDPAVVFHGDDHDAVVKLAEAAKAVQDVLGDHRDAMLFALDVREIDAEARDAGDGSADARADFAGIAASSFAEAARLLDGLPDAVAGLHEAIDAVPDSLGG